MTLRKLTSKTTLLDFLSHVYQEAEKQGKKRKALNIVSLQKSLTRFMNERNYEEMAIGNVGTSYLHKTSAKVRRICEFSFVLPKYL